MDTGGPSCNLDIRVEQFQDREVVVRSYCMGDTMCLCELHGPKPNTQWRNTEGF